MLDLEKLKRCGADKALDELINERRHLAGLYQEVKQMLEEKNALGRNRVDRLRYLIMVMDKLFGNRPAEDFITVEDIQEFVKRR